MRSCSTCYLRILAQVIFIIKQLLPRFGLRDDSANRWQHLRDVIGRLNADAKGSVIYKLIFLGRHGQAFSKWSIYIFFTVHDLHCFSDNISSEDKEKVSIHFPRFCLISDENESSWEMTIMVTLNGVCIIAMTKRSKSNTLPLQTLRSRRKDFSRCRTYMTCG